MAHLLLLESIIWFTMTRCGLTVSWYVSTARAMTLISTLLPEFNFAAI